MSAAPPGGGYGAQTADMNTAAGHVLRVNESIQNELKALQSRLEPLAAGWQGDAARAFTGLMQRWNTDAASLQQALQGIGMQIQKSGQAYEMNEAAQSSGFSKITSALG
jgi:WXG100 family type VII secretion target